MHDGMPHDPIQGQGHETFKVRKSISSGIFNVSWQMITDSETTEQYQNFYTEQIFDICPSFCVTWLRTWNGVTLILFANAFAIAITFARWWRRSESTAVPYMANFY